MAEQPTPDLIKGLAAGMRRVQEAMHEFGIVASIAMMKLQEGFGEDPEVPPSWEVESEQFMRGLTTDPRDES